MSDNEQPRDYTKTRQYALVDLASKIISTLALVVLGVAGWMLQYQANETRKAAEIFEVQERRYLPMLRSLSLLEVRLEDALNEIRAHQGTEASYDVGTRLRFIAESVFVPDGDPGVSLRPPDTIRQFGKGDQRIQMPLRGAAIMYAELMRMKLFFPNASDSATMKLDPQKPIVLIDLALKDKDQDLDDEDRDKDEKLPPHYSRLNVSPDSFPAWRAWLGDRTIKLSTAQGAPMNMLLQDLRFACSAVIHDVLSGHVDLGDRYVQIRDEVEKNRASTANHNVQPNKP